MPLQKSFSDQNHSSRQRRPPARWQRNKSYPGPQHQNDSKPNSVQDLPKVPISSTTRNKLSVFQFGVQPNAPAVNNAMDLDATKSFTENKENGSTAEKEDAEKDTNQLNLNRRNASSQSDGSSKPRREPPTTPAARLALSDLVGMKDIESARKRVSPDERILWRHDTLHSSGSSYGLLSRIKKRARSSSPSSSPVQLPTNYTLKGEALDLQRLSQCLQTPQTDPSADLWGRYNLNSFKDTPTVQQLPVLAHIMHGSSPQSSKETIPKSEGALRKSLARSSTCGTEWPKRRKVAQQQPEEDVFIQSLNPDVSKFSRVSALLDKVQQGYIGGEDITLLRGPSSSLTTPLDVMTKLDTSSPLQHFESRATRAIAPIQSEKLPRSLKQQIRPVEKSDAQAEPSSSDYGDFDCDAFDESMINPDTKGISLPEMVALENVEHLSLQAVRLAGSEQAQEEEHDEFGDTDEDLCAADLEDIVAKYDVRASGSMAREDLHQDVLLGDVKGLVAVQNAVADSDDEFGEAFDDIDFEAAEVAATQSLQQSTSSLSPQSTRKARSIQRYLVTNVLENEYETSNGLRPEKILLVQVDQTKLNRTIYLRDGWYETPVSEKAFVHVIGDFQVNGRCVIDDVHNMLILHPDHLISSTVVADSFSCTRRAVLQDRVKATSESSAPLVYGTILHEIFQAAMIANRWDTPWLSDIIKKIANQHLEDLYTIKLQISQAVEHLLSKMGELQSWAEVFISSQPKPEAVVKTANGDSATMCVSKLLDVEEHVWSPMYGLKGNIDATVQVTMEDGKTQRKLTVPFEVKTGKNASASHRAQTALYSLLLSDRYDLNIAYGILFYMETSETIRIPAIRHELRHMIMQRNELACYVRERHAQLPPMLKKPNMCNRCYAKTPCFIYHRLADEGNGDTSGMRDKFDEAVKHLTPVHKEFFLKWDDLLTKEEKESLKFRRELWTMLSLEREKLGRCFSNVIIEEGSAYEEQNNPKINRFRYTLIKQTPPAGFSFLDSQIIVGEPIVISDEEGHFALANGYVTHVRTKRITVAVDRRLHNARIRAPGFDENDNQVFASIMEVAEEGSSAEQCEGKIVEAPVKYRLDKDEFSNGMATVRNNLIQMMAEGPSGSREIRRLVVDLAAPRFKHNATAYTLADRASINVDQQQAIDKVMSARDYALVLGMPGTGKTTTIAHIIRALVSQGKSVLLTSYTHTAVDNILLKLKDDKIPTLRLGAITKIHSEVQEFVNLAAKPKQSFEELRSSWHDSPVVGTTCLGINHPIFSERTFDYCIVDEASQITLPVCLGPIRMARTFILVGDHNQLPPLVQNEEARAGGLDISLFKLLSDAHPDSVVNLEHQYRMCEEVMALSNCLIYNGRLKCGTNEVAKSNIVIPKMEDLKNHHYSPLNLSRTQKSICPRPTRTSCWIRDMVDPSTKVAFINTDTLLPGSREEAKGNRIVNPTEAKICVQLVESLLTVGVPANSIGVMTHYRSQLALLKHGLRSHSDVEMHTADRFQGRDKEVIILSLVRSNEAKSIGELLKDWRRINVAFTRAKTKLLVIGSRETLKGNASEEMVAKFIRLMEEKGWVYDLPKGAIDMHVFEDPATQVTASTISGVSTVQWKQIDDEKRRKVADLGKENVRLPPKRATIGKRVLLTGKPVLRNIVNDLFGHEGT